MTFGLSGITSGAFGVVGDHRGAVRSCADTDTAMGAAVAQSGLGPPHSAQWEGWGSAGAPPGSAVISAPREGKRTARCGRGRMS